ncbi:MAG: CoA pyrophosphatase [Myxococcaceae bacterium]
MNGEFQQFFDEMAQALARSPKALVLPPGDFREAAVLAPLVVRPDGPRLVFTKRPDTLRHHAGQISFPGGQRDPGDATPLATALRELGEELGVAASDVQVLGGLDELATPSRFRIAPFVGRLPNDVVFRPDKTEVEEVFEVPLADFLKPGVRREEQRVVFGTSRNVYFYDVPPRVIWGATGFIIHRLLERVTALPSWQETLAGL